MCCFWENNVEGGRQRAIRAHHNPVLAPINQPRITRRQPAKSGFQSLLFKAITDPNGRRCLEKRGQGQVAMWFGRRDDSIRQFLSLEKKGTAMLDMARYLRDIFDCGHTLVRTIIDRVWNRAVLQLGTALIFLLYWLYLYIYFLPKTYCSLQKTTSNN